jgi:ribose transport system ATP-binding protein
MLGSGRTELLRSIFGADDFNSGEVFVKGKKIPKVNLIKMKQAGLAMTPEDRQREGLVKKLSIRTNLIFASFEKSSPGIITNSKNEDRFAKRQIDELQIKLADWDRLITSLSGGNQQKVVVGNWLNTDPEVMFFDEPSRGIDVNAKQQIFQIIWSQARKGISSIIVSSELEELLEVCHRILILRHGKLVGEVLPENLNVEELYSVCMGGQIQ